MAIKDGLEAVDPIVRANSGSDACIKKEVLGPYDSAAMARANKANLVFEAPGHVTYGKDNSEIHMWFFGLLLCEYVAGILEKKSRQGHCNFHRLPPTDLRCPPAGRLHRDMLKAFGKAVCDLAQEIEAKVADLERDFPVG